MRSCVIPYSRKIWWGIKVGGLAVYITTAKLKFAKFSYLHIYIIMAIPYRTAKFKSANILAIVILGSTAKFNSCQYFQLYIRYKFMLLFLHSSGGSQSSADQRCPRQLEAASSRLLLLHLSLPSVPLLRCFLAAAATDDPLHLLPSLPHLLHPLTPLLLFLPGPLQSATNRRWLPITQHNLWSGRRKVRLGRQ